MMNRMFRKLFIVCTVLLTGIVFAQEIPTTTIPIEQGLSQRIALDLRDMDIVDALKFLAKKASINIIAGKDVSGKVSLFLKNVTTQDALNIILQANALAYENRGDVLYVMSEKEYKNIHGSNFSDTRKVNIVNLKFAKPEAVFKAVEILKSDIGKVMVDEESGSVILMDTHERIEQMLSVVSDLDRTSLTKTFVLKYAKAKEVEPVLAKRLDAKKTGSVSVDERSQSLIVTAFPDRMKEIEELIKGMDQKTKQVLIEAKILKIILTDNYSMGVNWNKVFTEAKLKGLSFASQFPTSPTPANFFSISGGTSNYDALLQILHEYGETRNLSSPSIAVVNGQEAKILVGTTQAYVTTTVATGSISATTAAQVSFLDVGVTLTLTPFINDDGYVSIKIKPEVSTIDSTLTYQIAPSVNNSVPQLAKTSAETTVMIKDGRTVVIGGLRKDEKIKTINKVPVLGDIPFLGAAFRNKTDNVEKTEIVVLITPHIITGDEEFAQTGIFEHSKSEVDEQAVQIKPPSEAGELKAKGMRGYE